MKKHNDDLIMACAIGCWVRDTAFAVNQRDVEYQKAFLSSITTSNRKLNTTIPGMIAYDKLKTEKKLENASKMYTDHLWLLKG